MNIEIFDITAIEQGVYRIAFRRSGAVSSYVVKLTEDPVPGISGPHSLWDLLGGNKEATGKLMAVLLEMHRTGSTNLPTQLSLEENGSKLNSTGVGYWSALSAWSLSQESISWASKHLITRGNNTLFPIPFEHQVIEGDRFHVRLPSSWMSPSFGRTGHSLHRSGRARLTHPVPR